MDISATRGQNAIYLAGLGFHMDTVLPSQEEAQILASLAERSGVHLKILVLDAKRIHFQKEKYDLVLSHSEMDRDLVLQIKRTLKPGGLLVVETSEEKHKVKEALFLFKEFRVLEHEEALRQGSAAGIIAQKPLEEI